MTKKIFFLQFFLIMLIFVFPPLFAGEGAAADLSRPTPFLLPCGLLAILLFFQDKAANGENSSQGQDAGAIEEAFQGQDAGALKAAIFLGRVLLPFGLLLSFSSLLRLLSLRFGGGAEAEIRLPQTAGESALCLLSLAASAFYEECLYRLYLPQALKKILLQKARRGQENGPARSKDGGLPPGGRKASSAPGWACEAAAVLLFAFAHRYQGLLAVANALFAGAVLRKSLVGAKSLLPPYLAHLLYNAAALLLS